MNDDKNLVDDFEEFEDDLLDGDEDFGGFESFDESDAVESQAEVTKPRERLWLYFGLSAFLLAALLRLLLSPAIDAQRQRIDQASDVQKQTELTNSAADQALTPDGKFVAFSEQLQLLKSSVNDLAASDGIANKIGDVLFNNKKVNGPLLSAWASYEVAADDFQKNKGRVTELKETLADVDTEINVTVGETISFVKAVAKEGRSKKAEKDRYLFLTSEAANINGVLSRLAAGMRSFYDPKENLKRLSDRQNTQLVQLKDTMTRLTGNAGAVVATAAEPLQSRFSSIETKLFSIGDNSSALTQTRRALNQLKASAVEIQNNAFAVGDANQQSMMMRIVSVASNILPLALVGFGLLALWRFFTLQSRTLVQSEGNLTDALAEQQESILKLLDEMSSLADGDLTVEAEVTDQITGAIADSVNFAVIEMRELVSQINRASLEVANESELAVNNAQSVSQSNMMQADQITSAAQEMQRITKSMREMSEQANESSEMARESIKVANQGAQAVRDTIEGMEDMREQIQETSKRIKRLGESSQRIGDIVALIDDIAEQTNILSLNAAIQASMAGEAGRGFAVVSDEVQSLAERSTEATKKIAELVTTIQNDTNDAVSSMEKATQQVVSGTRVADSAGSALAEIEKASDQLSGLVEKISTRSSRQAQVVTDVAQKVSVVSDSSTETSKKAQDSANSIAKLLELAKELETSVSRFKLPAS